MTETYVIDLFCGCGGFSEGARQAGAKVLLAIDSWKEALEVHKLNHPEALHLNQLLGGDLDEFSDFLIGFIDLNVAEGARVHLHASPPCQNLSSANPTRDEDIGMSLVKWSLELVERVRTQLKESTKSFTWSIEQVANKRILDLINKHGGVKVDMSKFGIPQTRRRVFLGT
ncbi:unnamed protein product, partial [Phaeothamnion confervicola]